MAKTITEKERQERNGKLVNREVLCCQTGLVEEVLKISGASCQSATDLPNLNDIENLYEYKCPECGYGFQNDNADNIMEICASCGESLPNELESEPQEILEWWLVTDWLAEKLKAQGEPILNYADFNYWWGRTCSGQAILLDSVIDKICEDLGW